MYTYMVHYMVHILYGNHLYDTAYFDLSIYVIFQLHMLFLINMYKKNVSSIVIQTLGLNDIKSITR